MTRLELRLSELQRESRSALVSFITAGDPSPDVTVPALSALVDGGVDVLELGIPFSDPEADGPSIQRSSERALQHGMTLERTLDLSAEFRQLNTRTPVILMGYLNPILALGIREFADRAAAAGVDGVIVVNLPYEEAQGIADELGKRDIHLICLIAPTTPLARAEQIAQTASGFLYYISLKGITGARHIDVDEIRQRVAVLKEITQLPIMVGFGIRTPHDARTAAQAAHGAVVGSVLVERMANVAAKADIPAQLAATAREFRNALDGNTGTSRTP